jgi:cytochrome c oxidase subunit IV
MAHDYESSKKTAYYIITVLAIITIGEVLFALAGKGYIVEGWHVPIAIMGGVMIILSLVKAYLIVYEFMHMKYEISGMVKSVLLPLFLLVWAIIAFLYEGNAWKGNRTTVQERNQLEVGELSGQSGMIYQMKDSDLSI